MIKLGYITIKEKMENDNYNWFKFSLYSRMFKMGDKTYATIQFSIKDSIMRPDNFVEYMKGWGFDFRVKNVKFIKGYMIAHYKRVYMSILMEEMPKYLDKLKKMGDEKVEVKLNIDFEELRSREVAKLL